MKPGDSLDGLSASDWNKMCDVVERASQRLQLGESLHGPRATAIPTDRVKVKNTSGAAVRRGEVLEFTDFALTDIEPGFAWFDGDTPDLTHVGWGLARRPVPEDEIGEFQIVGAGIAHVNFTDANFRFAYRKTGQLALEASAFGPVRILHKGASGTGEKECWILLGQPSNQRLGKTDASHAKGAIGTVSIWTGAPGSESDSGLNVAAYNKFATLASGKFVWVAFNEDGFYLTAGEC